MTRAKLDKLFNKLCPIQNIDELWWLMGKVKRVNPKVIVEIGVEFGGTFTIWGNLLPVDGLLVGVECSREKEKTLTENRKSIGCENHLIFADSHNKSTKRRVEELLAGKEVDFLFIDGDHTYRGVREDYRMYSPLVKAGGIIAFHDINHGYSNGELSGVAEFWHGLKGKKHENTVRIGTGYKIKE